MTNECQEFAPDYELPELSPEWLAKIEGRSNEFDAGLVTTSPWSEVKAQALKWLSADWMRDNQSDAENR